MKKYWLLLGFIFITNLVLADCFIEGAAYFISLEAAKAKEFLGLTAEETSDSAQYKEVVSVLKNKYAIDIENDIKRIALFVFPRGRISDYAVVISGNFDTEKMQNSLKKAIESEKWRFQKIDTIEIGGEKYPAFRADELLNIIYFNKNTIVISSDFILKKENIKLSNTPDSITNTNQTTRNYLYGNKVFFSRIKSTFNLPDTGLENSNSFICYIKDNHLFFEAEFNDSESSKEVEDKINNISKEQIEQFKSKYNDYLERIDKELAGNQDQFTQNTFELIFHSVYFDKSIDLISNFNYKTKDNIFVVSCNYDWKSLSSLTTAFIYKFIEDIKEKKIKSKCNKLTYAISMALKKYNREHDAKISTLDLKTLVKEKYLPKEPQMPSSECEYYFIDSDNIACKKHEQY